MTIPGQRAARRCCDNQRVAPKLQGSRKWLRGPIPICKSHELLSDGNRCVSKLYLLDVVGWAYGWLRDAGERSGNKSISIED
jgi:hypothetical protein